MFLGYARINTLEQDINIQTDALEKVGCKKVFQEKSFGKKLDHLELDKLLSQIHSGDTLIVYNLDRLGLTIRQLAQLLNVLKLRRINFRCISEMIFETNTPIGEMIFQIMVSLKELEENILRERTLIGLERAKLRGNCGGRKLGSYNKVKAAVAAQLYQKGDSVSSILTTLHISRSTLYEYFRKESVGYYGFTKSRFKQ